MNINGPGKYDDLCTYVREKAQAKGVAVIIIGGDKGQGFEVQADAETLMRLPTVLRFTADQIDGGGH